MARYLPRETLMLRIRYTFAAVLASAVTAAIAADAPARGVAYVSNQQGAVSVLNLDTLEVGATLDVAAKGPRGIGITADGKWLVTANMNDANISVIDTASGALLRHVPIGKNPEFVRVLGQHAFVTFEPQSHPPGAGGKPEVKDAKGGEDEDKTPGHIAVVDLADGKLLLDIVGKPETEGVEIAAGGTQLLVTNESDNSISVLDLATGRMLRNVPVGQYGNRPRGIKVSPDGHTIVTTLELAGKLLVFDEQFTLVKEVPTGKTPYGVAFDRAGKRLFVASNKDKLLQVFDTATWEKIKDIPTGDRCWHFSFTPDDRQVLVACGKSNEVVVVDAQTLEVSKRIGNLAAPWGIVTYPKSMGSID